MSQWNITIGDTISNRYLFWWCSKQIPKKAHQSQPLYDLVCDHKDVASSRFKCLAHDFHNLPHRKSLQMEWRCLNPNPKVSINHGLQMFMVDSLDEINQQLGISSPTNIWRERVLVQMGFWKKNMKKYCVLNILCTRGSWELGKNTIF